MATLKIDVAYTEDEGLEQACAELADGLDVQWRTTGVNVGGGWPEVEFNGVRSDLLQLARRYDPSGDARLRISAH